MYMLAKISNQVLLDIRQAVYEHIQKLSFHFFDTRPTGKILARVIGDVNSLKNILSDSVTTLIPDFITLVAVAVIMIVKNPKLAVASFVTVPFLIAAMSIIERLGHKRWQSFRKKTSNMNAYLHENLSGIRVVQSFAAEDESLESFTELVNEQKKAFVGAVRVSDMFSPTIEISWGVGGFLLYFIGIKILGVGAVGVGTFMAFTSYLSMFWSPIRNLANFYNKIITNISAAERVFDILDTEPDIRDEEGAVELPEIDGRVEFDHVSFAYSDEPDVMVLKDVSFKVKQGETIALVGPTGAGKSTVINLISRFYNATKGKVLVDDTDVKSVTLKSLREQMGIMTQDNFLFSGTIKDNIRYGKLDATDEEIIEAARSVHAHDFISKLEKGYDTEINERGARLSNGQRQLIAFARTMLSKPQILILDEATSSIDTHTEALVQKGIEAMLAGRTSFVIAHRLSTIKNADRIFVIDDGQIKEAGSHEELLAAKGAYYNLYAAQFKNIV
jgi:ATP-binding cassette subfamily B multidrug efflux pump